MRRYGFTAKLKISVLSNFEYLAIYDCSKEVKEDDSVDKNRIALYHYTEFEKSFEEIQKFLSHQSVYSGEFDETWQHIEDQLKLSSVDHLFLKQINDWRVVLGREIYSHNDTIDADQLNDLVQHYLNSIIFLRVCEDRNLEIYKTLLNFADTSDFNALIEQFESADTKYNAGLFNAPSTREIITSSNSAFWGIIKQLYYPESTFSFSVFSSDVLGNIYEIYLGEQLIIEDGEILLRKKPEHEDRDIVTTPTYIIQDILRQTIVKYCENKTDEEILNSSFADIACGSGAFLLEVSQVLHDILIDYYIKNDKNKLLNTSVDTYKLPFLIKKRILENCIHGVDKDVNAVRACRFGLLLKLLEDEENQTISSPALPNLENNIRYGNSLISPVQSPEESFLDINPCEFGERKFDVIVGNPPYMATEDMSKFTPKELPLYKENYYSAYKQFDKYFLFIEQGMNLLNEGGSFGYIVPSKFMKVGAGKNLREFLARNRFVEEIISFGANQVFEDKTTYTCLLILKNQPQKRLNYLEVGSLKEWKIRKIDRGDTDSIGFDELNSDVWILAPQRLKPIINCIKQRSETLESIVGSDGVFNGIQTSANRIYVNKAVSEDEIYYYFTKNDIDWKIEKILTRPYFETVKGEGNLNTYRPFSPNSFVVYPYLKTDVGIEFVGIEQLEAEFPCAFSFLTYYKDKLIKRDIKPTPITENEWYRYGRHQSLDKCDVSEKIIVGVLSKGEKYAIDSHSTFLSSGGTAGYCLITLPENINYSIYYIQAILNSKYAELFAILTGEVFRGGYVAHGSKILNKLPIRTIDFDNPDEVSIHDKVSGLQRKLIDIKGKIDKSLGNHRLLVPLHTQFNSCKKELDNLLKSLYGLGDSDNLIPLLSENYETN